MKKLITILAILMVLVGAIFAASETHTIKITVTIEETIPAFQLKFTGTDRTANSNTTPVQFANNGQRTDSTPATANIDFESNDAAARTITVDAYLANTAKQNKIYTLTFTDGAFKTSGQNPTTVATPAISAKAGSGAGYGAQYGVSTAAQNNVATVTFGGAIRCTANTLIAQADYVYPKSDIVPGTYTADIIMTVSTT